MTSRQATSCSIERKVEWIDTDAAGHQHNSAIMRWVESCEAELFRTLELPGYFLLAPRVQHVINYRDKLWFGQQVAITVTVSRIGRSSLTFTFEVVGGTYGDHVGGLAAYGSFTTAHVPVGATKSTPWPDSILSTLVCPASLKIDPMYAE